MKVKGLVWIFLSALFGTVVWAAGLRICPSCGREDETGSATCPACGAALPPVEASAPPVMPPSAEREAGLAPTNVFAEAARDVAEARRCRDTAPERALALYENAMALLAVEAGENFNEKAASTIAKDIEALRAEAKIRMSDVSALRLARQRGGQEADLFFRSAGRVACGRAWVPAAWLELLTPAQIASVRQSIPPPCRNCGGIGFEVCGSCSGCGKQPCRNSGCNQGWIFNQCANNLSQTAALKIRHKCPVCRGTAFAPCENCKGSGAVLCRKCGGNGEAPVCTACHGSGLADCRACKRSVRAKGGDEACRACKGTKQTLCKKCGGDGRVTK